MKPVVLDRIPFQVDLPQLLKTVRIAADGEDAPRVKELAQAAEAAARPKAVYRAAYIESKSEESVVIEGVAFKSRILRVNLDPVHRVFPYVATCGTELERVVRLPRRHARAVLGRCDQAHGAERRVCRRSAIRSSSDSTSARPRA